MSDLPTVRPAARALLVDARDWVLLFRCRDPKIDDPVIWIAPGGGLQEGETHAEAAARELFEETGLRGLPMGQCVWTRSHVFKYGDRMLDQREQFYLVRCGETPEIDRARHCPIEQAILKEHRWWSAEEIAAARDEVFTPRRISRFITELLRDGPPAAPIDVGI